MPTTLPYEIVVLILERLPLTVQNPGAKRGWDYVHGLSLASHLLRHLAMQRWFNTLRIGKDLDWEYIIDKFPWILESVKNLYLTETGWKSCFYSERSINKPGQQPKPTTHRILGLREHPRQVLAALTHLEAVHCDMDGAEGYKTLPEHLSDALPSTVSSLEFIHALNFCVVAPMTFQTIFQNLPNLRSLNLGACRSHCHCALCTTDEGADWIRSFQNTTALMHNDRINFKEDASLAAALSSYKLNTKIEFISFSMHLTLLEVFDAHIEHHVLQVPMYKCDACIAAGYSDTLSAETARAEALARALPSLKIVEWCSYFYESGKSRFVINRTENEETGDVQHQ